MPRGPLEVMGRHTGTGLVNGPLNDPDWGHRDRVARRLPHADAWFIKIKSPLKQLETLEKLVVALKNKYVINQLLKHREVARGGKSTVCPGGYLVPRIDALRTQLGMTGTK